MWSYIEKFLEMISPANIMQGFSYFDITGGELETYGIYILGAVLLGIFGGVVIKTLTKIFGG